MNLFTKYIGIGAVAVLVGSTALQVIPQVGNNHFVTVASASSKSKIKKVKLGMTKKQVKKILGKPDRVDSGMLTYEKYGYLYFSKGKLTGGEDKSIQAQVTKKNAAKKSSKANKRQTLLSQAKYFGTKDVESIQKATYAYASTEIDGGMMYMWKSKAGKLIRVDLDEYGKTAVYKYDDSKDNGLGEQLYIGKTILQKEPRTTVVYP
ncbi:outer membrane protein assembly factor BamE domain-containing protein [Weissella cibaria]